MNQTTAAPPSLFDLLAREWQAPAGIGNIVFNLDMSVVAFACVDGSLALAALSDPESPTTRLRTDLESGRATIKPREKPVRPVTKVKSFARYCPAIAPHRESGFAVGGEDGRLHHVTGRGQVLGMQTAMPGAVVALARDPQNDRLACAAGQMVQILAGPDMTPEHQIAHDKDIIDTAFSPDGTLLASSHGNGVSIRPINGTETGRRDIVCAGGAGRIFWDPAGEWIATPCASGGFHLIQLANGHSTHIAGYPAPVRMIAWSPHANALVTAGAFRTVAWSMNAPPVDGDQSGALVTGRPGLIAIDSVAAHPQRNLLAVGYANGLLNIVQIGQADELMLCADRRAGIHALQWSPDGAHLATGDTAGRAAIISFPPNMFK